MQSKKKIVLSQIVRNKEDRVSILVSRQTFLKCQLDKLCELYDLTGQWDDFGEECEYRYKYSSQNLEDIKQIEKHVRYVIDLDNLKDQWSKIRGQRRSQFEKEDPIEGYDIFLKIA